LTDEATAARIATVVAVRYRQVFLWPNEWNIVPQCHANSCEQRLCDNCPTWKNLRTIVTADYREPATPAAAIVPAYWIIPRRCYLFAEHKKPTFAVHRASHMFGEFKVGEKRYTYPLARGMYEALRNAGQLDNFDAIVPVPLSPDKQAAGELHRTLALSNELSRLLATPVRELLSLVTPISKRRMLSAGDTLAKFRARYLDALRADPSVINYRRVLIVDDVVTGGTTISCVISRLREKNAKIEVVVTCAGQMIVKRAVESEEEILR
jgi:predicted amidophosphoribosyltransferase